MHQLASLGRKLLKTRRVRVTKHICVTTHICVKSARIQIILSHKNSGKFFWRIWSGVERNVSRYRVKSGLFQ